MKKAVNILSIISFVSIFILILLNILWNDKNQRMSFICLWTSAIIYILAIPLIFRSFSLVANKDKIKPKTWLLIYLIAIFFYIIIAIKFGFINMTKDLPLAISEEYSHISGSLKIVDYSKTTLVVDIEGIHFNLPIDEFKDVESNEQYTFVYLPHSKYLIDIIGEDGGSLIIYR